MILDNPDGLNWRLKQLLIKANIQINQQVTTNKQERKRAPSEQGYHRFKATFVTLSLDAGIPIPIIQKIVGNKDVRVLLKHYHTPSKTTLSEQLNNKLPTVIGGSASKNSSNIEKAKTLLIKMNNQNWNIIREEMLGLLGSPNVPATTQ